MSSSTGCAYCGVQATSTCSKCKKTRYCSAQHQRADWSAHKLYCSKNVATVKGILFPTDSSTPRLVTIAANRFEESPSMLAGLYENGVPLLRPYLGAGAHDRLICKNAGGPDAPYVDQWLQVWIRDNFLNDGSPANQCARALVGPQLKHDWRGNFVVLKSRQSHSDRPTFVDASLADLETLTGWMRWYGFGAQAPEHNVYITSTPEGQYKITYGSASGAHGDPFNGQEPTHVVNLGRDNNDS
ncbi:unnamed protein product [Peniophora sp. CBMAI 1063]|nr:unnamed protein product [Peniophora sp. CBMAI 1063]